MARHVDEREPASVGELERRVAEVDRDPALPAPRAAGRCPCRSAPGRATSCRGRCARRCRRSAASARPAMHPRARATLRRPRPVGVGERAAVEQEPAVADDADHRRLALPQRRGERLLDRAGEARQLGERQRAAADAGDRLLDRAAGQLREALGAGADRLGRLARACAARGPRAGRARDRGRARASPRARPASACRRAARAGAGGAGAARPARRGRRRSRPAGRRAACRPRSRRGRRRRRARRAPSARRGAAASAPEPRSSTSGQRRGGRRPRRAPRSTGAR